MALSLTCSCGAFLEVDDKFAGQQINCPDCQAALQVPPLHRVVTRTSGFAIASLVLALVGAFTVVGTLAAIGFGTLALRQIRKRPEEVAGRSFALAGIVLGVVLTLLSVGAYTFSDRLNLDALLYNRRLEGKLEFDPEQMEIHRHREGFAITRPSKQWGVLREPPSSGAPVPPQEDLKLVTAARDAEIVCRLDFVPGHWSLEQASDWLARGFKDPFGNGGYVLRNPQRLPSLNDADVLEMYLERGDLGGSRTYLVRLIKRKSRDRDDNRQVQMYVVSGGARKSRFRRLEPEIKKALESFRLLER
jgi:hypothetical protein